jgi:hypothetical protein
VEGNARLTSATAAVLLVLLAAEGVTVLRVRSLLNLHVVIGLVLVPPIVVKIGSTTWKFSRYYLRDRAYVRKGPPVLVLRLLGPIVIVLTVILFGSGIWLLLQPHAVAGRLRFIHQASFVLWFGAMTVHVLGHLVETGRFAPRDWRPRTRAAASGAGRRQALLLLSLVAGAVLAAALFGHVATYLDGLGLDHLRPGA